MFSITENMQWPPMDAIRFKIAEHSAWYSGEGAILSSFYATQQLEAYLTLPYGTSNRNKFWYRQSRNNSHFNLHVPIASDIAETSASFLFGESPIIRFASTSDAMKGNQEALDKMLMDTGFFRKIVEAAEVCSALGGVYIKVVWDKEVSKYPVPVIVQCDQAFPRFKCGKLVGVTFIYEIRNDGSKVYRLAEDISKGVIRNMLYEGSSSNLGKLVDLTTIDEAADISEEIKTPDIMTAVYIANLLPNKLDRTSPSGRSDYQGLEDLMDALDEVFTNWMIDIKIARGKIHVPKGYIEKIGETEKFNEDTMAYVEMEADPTSLSKEITATQFEIRSEQFEKTILNLLDRIITSAGYSPQSFGLNIAGRAESGTALNVRERKSFSTTNKKQSYWESELKDIIKAMCMVYVSELGGQLTCDLDVNVAFADGISNNLSETSNSIKTLSDAKALSTKTKIQMVHPEWTEEQVKAEMELINNDGVPAGNPEDLFEMAANKNNQMGKQNEPNVNLQSQIGTEGE